MALPEGNLIRSSFRKGMLFDVNDHVAPEDSVRFIDNMLPSPIGALTTREGRTRKNTNGTGVIGEVVYDMFRWQDSVTPSYKDIIAYDDGTNLKYADATTAGDTVDDITTDPNPLTVSAGIVSPIIGMQKKFRLFLNNGANKTNAIVLDTTVKARTVGLGDGPAVTATQTATNGGQAANAVLSWRITVLYGDDGESNPGTADGYTASDNDYAILTWNAPPPPFGMTITGYRIWRSREDTTDVGGTTNYDYRLVDQVGISADPVTYNDVNGQFTPGNSGSAPMWGVTDTIDATVSGNELMHDNHNAPPDDLTGMVWWDYEDIAVGWGENADVGGDKFPQRLFFSEIGNPEVWKTEPDSVDATNTAEFQDVPQRSNDNPVVTCVVNGSFLYVFNRKGVRVLTPTSVSRAYKVDIVANSSDHGIIGPKSVTVTDSGEIYYVSTDGLRRIRGNVDVEVSANTDSANRGLTVRGAIGEVGNSVNSIIHGVPAALRPFVYAHEYRDRIHISLGTNTITGITPTKNNDVLIYDVPTGGFAYSSGRQVYGWETLNDSGNEYELVSCGYTVPVTDPTTTSGNFWTEYTLNATTDEDAEGVDHAINWKIQDFNRAMPGFTSVKLREFLIDAASSTGVITAQLLLDSGRLTSTKQFTFSVIGKTYWQDASYWQSDASNNLSLDSNYGSGVALSDLVTLFAAVTDGEFRIVIDAGNVDPGTTTPMNFSSVTTIEEVVTIINTALDEETSGVHCDYLKTPGAFRFTHDTVGATKSITDVLAVPAGSGTDIATAALLGTGASEIVRQAVTAPAVPLVWWDTDVADPTNAQYFWSSGTLIRGAPRRAEFFGERAQMIATTISCTTKMTIYGYRIRYHVLEPIGAGVQ